jgi:hypothetical protein
LSVDNTDEENQDEENVEGRYGEAWEHDEWEDEGEKKNKDEGNVVKVGDV